MAIAPQAVQMTSCSARRVTYRSISIPLLSGRIPRQRQRQHRATADFAVSVLKARVDGLSSIHIIH
ncbi:hypothetical protein FSB08_18530 [Paraburkholderia sp. JPY432]|nr:hypothetical protein [Paraburkholderia youngii]